MRLMKAHAALGTWYHNLQVSALLLPNTLLKIENYRKFFL